MWRNRTMRIAIQKYTSAISFLFSENLNLVAGLCILIPIFFLGFIGPYVFPLKGIEFASYPRDLPPSPKHLLGTDTTGRDLFTVLLLSIRQSLLIGLIAGTIGTTIGTALGLIAGCKGGIVDSIIRSVTDVFLIIPTWPLLVILSAYLERLTIPALATLLAVFSWPGIARGVRSQALSLRERAFVKLAKLSGENSLEIVFKEIFPNILPYVGTLFGLSMTGAMLAEVGLEIIGLGPSEANTLGLMIYWAIYYNALVKRMWWWIFPPVICLVAIFVGIQLLNAGLDRLYNPRLRR